MWEWDMTDTLLAPMRIAENKRKSHSLIFGRGFSPSSQAWAMPEFVSFEALLKQRSGGAVGLENA